MPRPNGPIKQSGDTHLPDIESDLEIERHKAGLLRAQAEEHVAQDHPEDLPVEPYPVEAVGQPVYRPLRMRPHISFGKIAIGVLGLLVLRKLLR